MSKTIYQDEHTRLLVLDDPDPDAGGACHDYQVSFGEEALGVVLPFQHGPIAEAGLNGVQHIHLLQAIKHRLECFQEGTFASEHNALCLKGVQMAIKADEGRTADRQAAGAEGQNELAEGVELARTHVNLAESHLQVLRSRAIQDGSSVAHHVRRAVEQYLSD